MAERLEQSSVVEAAKQHFLATVESIRIEHPGVSFYPTHVAEVERWAKRILKRHPEADEEIVLLGVWLHDIGNLIGDKQIDHAKRSETEVNVILPKLGLAQDKIEAVAHCVRSHRNSDVTPSTLEARIVAAADSASHMTGDAYLPSVGMKRTVGSSLAKLGRDYRDIDLIPGLKEELTPLYNSWVALLNAYPNFE